MATLASLLHQAAAKRLAQSQQQLPPHSSTLPQAASRPPAGAQPTSVTPPAPAPVIRATSATPPTIPLGGGTSGPAQGPSAELAPSAPAVDWRARLREIRDEKRKMMTKGRSLAAKGGGTPAEMRALIEAHRALRGEERFFEEMDMDGDGIPDARQALDTLRQGV